MYDILLVEDEKLLRDAYTTLLAANGRYRVDVAANGREALDLCSKHTYDIILLDLMMPVLDGAGFLRQAKLTKTAPSTRVIIMSNLSTGSGLGDALKLGAHRHAVKSDLSPMDVLDLIKQELPK